MPSDKVYRNACSRSAQKSEIKWLNDNSNVSDKVSWVCSVHPRDGIYLSLSEQQQRIFLYVEYPFAALQILAHFSNCHQLKRAFMDEDMPLEFLVASWMNIPESKVTQDVILAASHLVDSIIRNKRPSDIAKTVNISVEKVQRIYDDFQRSHHHLSEFIDLVLQSCRDSADNTVQSLIMRQHYHVPNINSQNSKDKKNAEQEAIQFVIHGSVTEVLKLATSRTQNALQLRFKSHANSSSTFGIGTTNDQAPAKLLLQMDSGFLFDVKNNYIEEISTIIQRAMQSVCELPLRVVARTGNKWSSLVPNK